MIFESLSVVKVFKYIIPIGWDEEVKLFAALAKFKKMNFDAYVQAGFTEAQALELIK